MTIPDTAKLERYDALSDLVEELHNENMRLRSQLRTREAPTVAATYNATDAIGSTEARRANLPRELHHLVLWCLTHPEQAGALLPAYHEARAEAREETA